ncbi:hypothetical protein RJ639_014169 [Escallonia herrerae]|uniref:DYW domain-containing protein n=1 Tax=Escallonia herrerae TaxID=1293975 RepID=A0AA88VJ45_9ASTE|nr:hypothetical protein RJ639_014169 [Escallonia herrerae]
MRVSVGITPFGPAEPAMALHLKLGFSNLPYCSSPCRVTGCVESQMLNSSTSQGKVAEPRKFGNALKLFDKEPKRIVSAMDFDVRDYNNEPAMGIEETSDSNEFDTSSKEFGERCIQGMSILFYSAENVMNRSNVIEFISCCGKEKSLELGKVSHALVMKTGLGSDKFVSTSTVNMYAKCGEMCNAVILFNQMLEPDIASCNCLISGYASNGLFNEAFDFFVKIANMGIMPNHYTYSILLTVCGTSVSAIEEGRQLHGHVVKTQYLSKTPVANALLTMYSKCGMMEEAEFLFESIGERNLVSWTVIISGFYQSKAFEKAWALFYSMKDNGIEPNEYTFAIALACCGVIGMYSEFGEMADAEKQLQEMGRIASNVSRNALLAGYVCNDKAQEAMEAFLKMVKDDAVCNEFTYSTTLKACSSLPSLASGKQIQCRIIKAKLETNLYVASSLIELYAKCGNLEGAERVFNLMPKPDAVSWNSMIKAYAQYGYPMNATFLFNKMVEGGERPTSSTFLAVLSACSHSGLVQQGEQLYESMVKDCGIPPEEAHYSCMVDLLGRSGQLEEALEFIENLPIKLTAAIWRPLLAACRYYGNLQLAEVISKHILDLDPLDATVYVTLSNMYAEIGSHADAETQRKLMVLNNVSKQPGCSWMEIGNRTCQFFSGDKTHPELPKVYERLKQLMQKIKDTGHINNSTTALNSATGGSTDGKILYHSEKLAVCFGLISLPAGSPIRIFKNLRREGIRPNKFVLPSALKACGHLSYRRTGETIHAMILRNEFESDAFVSATLIDMYSKCGRIGKARRVFDRMVEKDLVALNALASGFVQQGLVKEALGLFDKMKFMGLQPNVVTWNTLIAGFSQASDESTVTELFQLMNDAEVEPDVDAQQSKHLNVYSAADSGKSLPPEREVITKLCEGEEGNATFRLVLLRVYYDLFAYFYALKFYVYYDLFA